MSTSLMGIFRAIIIHIIIMIIIQFRPAMRTRKAVQRQVAAAVEPWMPIPSFFSYRQSSSFETAQGVLAYRDNTDDTGIEIYPVRTTLRATRPWKSFLAFVASRHLSTDDDVSWTLSCSCACGCFGQSERFDSPRVEYLAVRPSWDSLALLS